MSFDIALSHEYDLVFSASGDLAGVDATNLIVQRIKLRLRIERGSWVLDDEIGSIMTSSLARITSENFSTVDAIIRDALRPMTDIQIDEIQLTQVSATQLQAKIMFTELGDTDQPTVDAGSDETTVTIGIAQTSPEEDNAA